MLIAHGHRRDDALSYYQRGLQTLPTRQLPANMGSTTFTARPLQGEIEVKTDTAREAFMAGLGLGAGMALTGVVLNTLFGKKK